MTLTLVYKRALIVRSVYRGKRLFVCLFISLLWLRSITIITRSFLFYTSHPSTAHTRKQKEKSWKTADVIKNRGEMIITKKFCCCLLNSNTTILGSNTPNSYPFHFRFKQKNTFHGRFDVKWRWFQEAVVISNYQVPVTFCLVFKRKENFGWYDDMAIEMSAQYKKQQETETKGHALMYS
jgi:hypothetical protein